MENNILIFLAIAITIIALAVLLTKWFSKTIKRDKRNEDINGDQHDASGHATWIGINKSGGDEI